MSYLEENEVKVTEPAVEPETEPETDPITQEETAEAVITEADTTESVSSTEYAAADTKKKKKRPFIQVPVIISMCLVVFSLLAFFAYKIIWITEPEGTIWVWSSETDNINWYFEFKDNNVFKAYVGSFEITANYSKDKSEGNPATLMVSSDMPYTQSIGCIFFGNDIHYTVKGSRLFGNQEMIITYPADPEGQEFVLTQVKELEPDLELPEDFTGDDALTGEWVNVYSSDQMKQTIVFNSDGSMELSEIYDYSGGNYSEFCRHCTYTVMKDESAINITWRAEDTVVHHSEYSIEDGILMLDGAAYYRAGNHPATPDQAIE